MGAVYGGFAVVEEEVVAGLEVEVFGAGGGELVVGFAEGVGFLAVPVMTTGAAYDLCQVVGWNHSLHAKPAEAKKFYGAIAGFTLLAMMMNFLGFNPMKALVFSGVVQGFSTPPLLLMIMLMTNSRRIMGNRINTLGLNILGWITTVAIFAASIGLVVSWFL